MTSAGVLGLALAASAFGGATSGCRSVELTARDSSVPVLLGPVRSVGGGPAPATRAVRAFGTRSSDARYHASVAVPLPRGRTVVVSSEAWRYRSADDRARRDIEDTTRGDERATIELHEAQCGGHLFVFLGGFFNFVEDEAWCRAKGTVRRPATARRE